jgi:hypothetical protein
MLDFAVEAEPRSVKASPAAISAKFFTVLKRFRSELWSGKPGAKL